MTDALKPPIGLSPMHEMHAAAGAAMVEQDGWLRPSHYTPPQEEFERVRRSVGMCDVSSTGKVLVYAEDADAILETTFGLSGGIGVGRAAWSADALLARMTRDEVWALPPAAAAAPLCSRLTKALDGAAHVVDVTSGLAGAALVGPEAFSVLATVTELDVSRTGFADMACAQTSVAGVRAALIRNDENVPRLDLYFGREYGEHVWSTLLEAGAIPIGFRALQLTAKG